MAAQDSIWIWVKPDSAPLKKIAEELANSLRSSGAKCTVGGVPGGGESFALSIGGDGTFLSMVRRLGNRRFSTTLLGIHGSRGIGFMTGCKIPLDTELMAWSQSMAGKIIARDGVLKEYFGLEGILNSETAGNQELWALNDIVISRTALSRMLSLQLDCNDETLYEKLKGDGIILSSALGSTAYSLSAGGPVLDPALRVLQMTPICPHPKPQPPMVFGHESKLKAVSLDGTMKAMVTLDGQEGLEFGVSDELFVSVSRMPIQAFIPCIDDQYSRGSYFQSLARLGIGGAHVSGS